jgi:hypothetical protein
MARRDQLQDLHLALEGAVDQMTRAQRISTQGELSIEGLDKEVDASFAEVVRLRNRIREELMKELSKPPPAPTIRIRK